MSPPGHSCTKAHRIRQDLPVPAARIRSALTEPYHPAAVEWQTPPVAGRKDSRAGNTGATRSGGLSTYPALKEHPQRGNEGERLVEHDMVLGLGHLDDRRERSHQLGHVGCGAA